MAQDVVFVLDKSGASYATGIDAKAQQFLTDIKQQADEKGLNIKVGIVNFYYAGKVHQELTDVVKNYDDIQNKLKESVLGFGTNMHAGLWQRRKCWMKMPRLLLRTNI
ncbi:vWA domain-containing protein [Varibaculum vaginae]|uniref:vWA domain-containing protein n=1 Tax=Varibaculum vaginae TaxID=2364797 RepID=UPI000F073B08|nr:vWA domain-containing protein [Varibaculum vaginae]